MFFLRIHGARSLYSLTLSPFQLGTQDVKECAFGMQQSHLKIRLAAEYAVTIPHRHTRLPINAQVGFFFSGHDNDFNVRRVTYDQRTVSQRVRRNWRDHKTFYIGHENWATCGQRIRSRAGRSGNDQAVGLIAGDEDFIDENIAVVEPGNGSLPDHNVIEGVKAGDD